MRGAETLCLFVVAVAITLAPLATYWTYVERDAGGALRGGAVDVRLAPLFSPHRIQQIDPYSLPLPAPARPGAHWRALSTLLFGFGEQQATLMNGTVDGECRALGAPFVYSDADLRRWRTLVERGYRLDWRLGGMPALVTGEPARFGVPLGRADGPHLYLYNHIDFLIGVDAHDRVLYVYAAAGPSAAVCGEPSVEPTLANASVTWSYSISVTRDERIAHAARWHYYEMVTSAEPAWLTTMLIGISTVALLYVLMAICPVIVRLARREALDRSNEIELEDTLSLDGEEDAADSAPLVARSPISALKRHYRLLRTAPCAAALSAAAVGRGVQLAVAVLAALACAALARSPWDTTWARSLVLLLPTTSWIAGLVGLGLMHWFRAPGALSMLGWSMLGAPLVYGVALCVLLIEDAVAPTAGTIALLVVLCAAALALDGALVLFGMWMARCMPSSGRAPLGLYVPPRAGAPADACANELSRSIAVQGAVGLPVGAYLVYAGAYIMLNAHASGHAVELLIAIAEWCLLAALAGTISAVRFTVRAQMRWLHGVALGAAAGTTLFFVAYLAWLFGSTPITDRDGLSLLAFVAVVAYAAVTLVIGAASVVGPWLFFGLLETHVFLHAD